MIADFKQRFWVILVLTIPVLLFSDTVQGFLGFQLDFPGKGYTLFGLATLIFFYGGRPFLSGLVEELQHRQPGMMTLIGLAITVAYGYSTAVVFGLAGQTFFWELATLILIMLLGHWIEMRAVSSASNALEQLAALLPATAHLIQENGETQEVSVEALVPSSLIQVKPGEKIPADGTITQGQSYLNEAMLTGESEPVAKGEGDAVIAGAINERGSLQVQVSKTGDDTYLNKVITMVQQAQEGKSQTQRLADKAALWLTITALSVGFVTLAVWLSVGQTFLFSLERMVTVMIITCPHALGLAIPLVSAIATSASARNGLLIRNRTAFEQARNVTAVLFDKTGTLTTGEFGVKRFDSLSEHFSAKDVLRYTAAVEVYSEHPFAAAIIKQAQQQSLTIPEARAFEAMTGQGIAAQVDGHAVKVVSPGYLQQQNKLPNEPASGNRKESLMYVLVDEEVIGYLGLADSTRRTSREAVRDLQAQGIKTYMLTGDHKRAAEDVSKSLNLDGYFAEMLPDSKLEKVREMQAKGEVVAMTGDGINDAPALAQADIGIAVGSGTDIAAETADIVLVNSDPKDIKNLLLFGKATYRKMIQNLFWATGYNVIAIPLAAGVLYTYGIMISPALGAVLMSLSTIVVALNAQLLKRSLNST